MAMPDPVPPANSVGDLIPLLDYRVSSLERRLDVELGDIHKAVDRVNASVASLPQLIERKFRERGNYWVQIGTLLAAAVAAIAAMRGMHW